MKGEVFERVYSGHWFVWSYLCYGFVYDFPKWGGGSFISKCAGLMEGDVCRIILDPAEYEAAANFTADRLISDHKWREGMYRKIDNYTRQYFLVGEKLRKMDFSGLSDKEIVTQIKEVSALQHYHHNCSVIVNGMVIDGRNHLSNKIREELQREIGQREKLDEYWSLLTLVTKLGLRQKKDYAIALLAKEAKRLSQKEVEGRLKKLHQQYCWLDYVYLGPTASLEKFKQELDVARKNKINPDLPRQLNAIRTKQEKLMQKLKMSKWARFLVRLAQHVIWQKGYRKDVQYHGFYCYEPCLRELARRKQVDNWQLFFFLLPWEIKGFVLKNRPTISELEKRKDYSCLVVNRKSIRLKMGKEARSFVKTLRLKEDFSYLSETKGQCAYIGRVKGMVKIVQVPSDMSKMRRGDILLSQATTPDLLPAIKKATAIVTNTGGLICHAAIVARELKIPCVVGTSNATLIFKDGDLVEVDANKGIVRKIK